MIDISSVKKNATNTIKFLNDKLSKRTSNQRNVVVFLGEMHGNAIDQNVTRAMLADPPIIDPGNSRVIFERGLDQIYVYGLSFTSHRVEATNLGLNRLSRSQLIAEMIDDAFQNHGVTTVYVPCGSAHEKEIYDSLNKRCMVRFTYISKLSSQDKEKIHS
jgi:hypothetical protein